MMALTRSAKADYPCPVCLIPKALLAKPGTALIVPRVHQQVKDIVLKRHLYSTQKQHEQALQSLGLHNNEVR